MIGSPTRMLVRYHVGVPSLLHRISPDRVNCEALFINPVHVVSECKPEGKADRYRKRSYDPEFIYEDIPGEA